MKRYKVTRSGQPESRSFCPYGVKGASPSQYIHMFTNQEAPQSLGVLSFFIISVPHYISMIDSLSKPPPLPRGQAAKSSCGTNPVEGFSGD